MFFFISHFTFFPKLNLSHKVSFWKTCFSESESTTFTITLILSIGSSKMIIEKVSHSGYGRHVLNNCLDVSDWSKFWLARQSVNYSPGLSPLPRWRWWCWCCWCCCAGSRGSSAAHQSTIWLLRRNCFQHASWCELNNNYNNSDEVVGGVDNNNDDCNNNGGNDDNGNKSSKKWGVQRPSKHFSTEAVFSFKRELISFQQFFICRRKKMFKVQSCWRQWVDCYLKICFQKWALPETPGPLQPLFRLFFSFLCTLLDWSCTKKVCWWWDSNRYLCCQQQLLDQQCHNHYLVT